MTLIQVPRSQWCGAVVEITRRVEGRGPKEFTYKAIVLDASNTSPSAKVQVLGASPHTPAKWMGADKLRLVSLPEAA